MGLSLVKKLTEVMQQVKYIQKSGFNKFHNYKYATEADVNEKVREELANRGVILIPNMKSHETREHTTAKGNREYIVTVEVEFTFMDGESGEAIAFTVFGQGQDPGDKATYKAFTGAQKYALMKALMIPTGDDPEGDSGVDERNAGNTESAAKKESTGRGGNNHPQKNNVKPSLEAKYKHIHGNTDGLPDFIKEHGADAEKVLTQMLMEQQGA
ncbi:ERF family protein [Paenibacillus alvei]|uniref:ERF superfamily protein n=1 Tax=Paenibacillus alvei TaxID=44250 RepID=A0A383RFR4_PAEAL|nr:ERF family protein [Paenibacillus alvei]SYX85937.1 conserved protein of unknown function [Paenibacillus alvei]SYX87689.1 conserved protein of unknown function [Paenibacillus alvei]